MIDLIRSAYRSLGRKRGRTVLTILGIAIGVASVILIGNISQCGTNAPVSYTHLDVYKRQPQIHPIQVHTVQNVYGVLV